MFHHHINTFKLHLLKVQLYGDLRGYQNMNWGGRGDWWGMEAICILVDTTMTQNGRCWKSILCPINLLFLSCKSLLYTIKLLNFHIKYLEIKHKKKFELNVAEWYKKFGHCTFDSLAFLSLIQKDPVEWFSWKVTGQKHTPAPPLSKVLIDN